MIEVQNLSKSYGGIQAIEGLNFSIQKGEVVGFLGPNGAGKSTTMKIMTGFMAPTSGKAILAGFDVFEDPIEVKRRIGYLPETPPVYGDMRVNEYLTYVAQLKGVESAKISAGVKNAIEKMHLGSVEKRMIQNLSKGFKQRVGIAQALVSNPDILILDEPTVGLDPRQVSEIRDLIRELKGQHTIVLSTHILPEVQATCERIIIIHQGKIVAQDSLENLSKIKAGRKKIMLRVRKTSDDLLAGLKGLEGVSAVGKFTEDNQVVLETMENDEVIDRVAGLVLAKSCGLLEITSEKANLEDVFLKLTYGANP